MIPTTRREKPNAFTGGAMWVGTGWHGSLSLVEELALPHHSTFGSKKIASILDTVLGVAVKVRSRGNTIVFEKVLSAFHTKRKHSATPIPPYIYIYIYIYL